MFGFALLSVDCRSDGIQLLPRLPGAWVSTPRHADAVPNAAFLPRKMNKYNKYTPRWDRVTFSNTDYLLVQSR